MLELPRVTAAVCSSSVGESRQSITCCDVSRAWANTAASAANAIRRFASTLRAATSNAANRDDPSQTDDRDVHVAVGMSRRPDLHDADHRKQRSQIPEPANPHITSARSIGDEDDQRKQAQDDPRHHDGREVDTRVARGNGVRIEDGQIDWPQRLTQIHDVRNERVLNARDRLDVLEPDDRATGPLREEGQRARDRAAREERQLLEPHRARGTAFERPHVEQQECARQRDREWLCEQRQRATNECDAVPEPVATAAGGRGIAAVGPHRRHPEQAAQRVLALGDPRDGFDVKRMQGEDRGDEGARPEPTPRTERAALAPRHPGQRREEQHRTREMQHQVRQVEAARVGLAVDLAIEHQAEPGQRVPVRLGVRRERPFDSRGIQPRAQPRIVEDVLGIVVLDEVEAADRAVDDGAEQDDRERDGREQPPVRVESSARCGPLG